MIGAMAGSATPQTGWDALRAAQWEAARAAFDADLAGNETAAVLDGLARARWWLSDLPGAIEAWERAYATYRRGGQEVTVEVTVPARDLAHWDGETHAWTIEQGRFRLAVGPSYSDERLTIEVATRS